MTKWLVEVSDVITGALIIRGQRFTAGRHVTEDPYVAERVGKENSEYFQVRELEEDEEVKTWEYQPEDPPTGTLTSQDLKDPESTREGKKECRECGIWYKSLKQHGRLSGHDVHGAEASKKAGEAEDAKNEEPAEEE